MSYILPGSSGVFTATSGGSVLGGLAMGIYTTTWWIVMSAIAIGSLVALMKFGPRLALEPVDVGYAWKWRFTINGRRPKPKTAARHRMPMPRMGKHQKKS